MLSQALTKKSSTSRRNADMSDDVGITIILNALFTNVLTGTDPVDATIFIVTGSISVSYQAMIIP